MNRDKQLIDLRPKVVVLLEDNKNVVEAFMHQTLRPVLKFQHLVLISCIKKAPHFEHLQFKVGRKKKNRELLKNFLQKNNRLRSQLQGLIIALFTEKELACYFENDAALNKRISEMVITRFLSEIVASPLSEDTNEPDIS